LLKSSGVWLAWCPQSSAPDCREAQGARYPEKLEKMTGR
jgi:hypothetical protein